MFIAITKTQMITSSSVEASSRTSYVPLTWLKQSSTVSLLSGMTRCSRFVLYTVCAIPGIYHFSNKPQALLVRIVLKLYQVLGLLIATASVFVARCFQWADMGKIHVDRCVHTYLPIFYICFFSCSSPKFLEHLYNHCFELYLVDCLLPFCLVVFLLFFHLGLVSLSPVFGCLSVFVSYIR